MKSRKVTTALAAGAAVIALSSVPFAVAPAAADSFLDTLFGSLGAGSGPNNQSPTKPAPNASPNGVYTITTSVDYDRGKIGPNLFKVGFAPEVKWSARDRSNAEVKGSNCQIEVQFPGTSSATYKSGACQGGVWFNSDRYRYRTPGAYSIVVVDKVSGAQTSYRFTIE